MTLQIIIAIIGIAGAVFGGQGFWLWLMSKSKGKQCETKLLMGLAYDKILQRCNYYIDKGYIDADEYQELYKYLYKPYQEMGGNGTAERLMEIVKHLPVKGGEHEQN